MRRDQRGFAWLALVKWIVVIVVVAAVFWLGFGIGKGKGKGGQEGDGDTVEVSEEAEEITPITEEMEYLTVSISGSDYIYQNSKVSLDELMTQLTNSSVNVPVRIADDNASRNAYTDLIEALREKHIRYIE